MSLSTVNRHLLDEGPERDPDSVEGDNLPFVSKPSSRFGAKDRQIVCSCAACRGRVWTVREVQEAARNPNASVSAYTLTTLATAAGHPFEYANPSKPAGDWAPAKLLPHGGRAKSRRKLEPPAPRERAEVDDGGIMPINPNGPGLLAIARACGLPRFPGGGATIRAFEVGYRFDAGADFAREADHGRE
jgi:hypothetical protein